MCPPPARPLRTSTTWPPRSQLTELELLERRQDPADRRVAHLHPTAMATARQRLAEVRRLKTAYVARCTPSRTGSGMPWARPWAR
ncbi:hypothetical protein [Streptosporangium canum]|uniref:hypothetical protein n=1 Tax=Streptosporangium canum TaxID=324952 RepID=UPI0033A22387